MSADKGGAAAGEGVGAKRRGEDESPGLPRAGGFGCAEALRGAPSGGRAERVSGCRGRAASPQPAWDFEGFPRGGVTPRSLGDRGGPLPPPAFKVLSSSRLPSPRGRLLEAARVPVCPLPRLLRSYSEELGGGGSRADPLATSTLPPGRVQAGVGFCCVYSCTRAFLIFFTPIIICGISILGTGGFSAAFLSEKAFCYLWCEGGDLASGKLVGAFRVRLSLLRSPPPPSLIFLRTLMPCVVI